MRTDILTIPPNGSRLAYRHTAPGLEVVEELHSGAVVFEVVRGDADTIAHCFECLELAPIRQGDRLTITASPRTYKKRRATAEGFIYQYSAELDQKATL